MYFDIDAHRDCFKAKEDEAYFWHGRNEQERISYYEY